MAPPSEVIVCAISDMLVTCPRPLLVLKWVHELAQGVLDAADRARPHARVQGCALRVLATDYISYSPVAKARAIPTARAALTDFPGSMTITDLVAQALARGARRAHDYRPLTASEDYGPDCDPADVIEIVRLLPARCLPQTLVFLSYCPAGVLKTCGVLEPVLRFGQDAAAADPIAWAAILVKAGQAPAPFSPPSENPGSAEEAQRTCPCPPQAIHARSSQQ